MVQQKRQREKRYGEGKGIPTYENVAVKNTREPLRRLQVKNTEAPLRRAVNATNRSASSASTVARMYENEFGKRNKPSKR